MIDHSFILFQSAPPSRAATQERQTFGLGVEVSIRAALTGGDRKRRCGKAQATVSIRAALTGGDQSAIPDPSDQGVSIRAALTGGDHPKTLRTTPHRRFNPRRPHGRRPVLSALNKLCSKFQSAPPSRAATSSSRSSSAVGSVSIRAALTGGDFAFIF